MSGVRFIAQRVLTGAFLDWDVPIALSTPPRRDLSGPGSLEGTISPEYARLIGSDGQLLLQEWGTAIYYEVDGHIRWGGLLTDSSFEGNEWNVSCSGFTTYPHGMPYLGPSIRAGLEIRSPEYNAWRDLDRNNDGYIDNTEPPRSTKVPAAPVNVVTPRVDAFDVVRAIWTHLQDQPDGDLGVVVDGHDSGVLLGSTDGKDPYELVWWETPDCGGEIDSLAKSTPFDYQEEHSWADATQEVVLHKVHLGRPRIGRRRDDLRFQQSENIIAVLNPQRGDEFANEVFAVGKGEGRKMLHGRFPVRDGRLRRTHLLTDKLIGNATRLRSLAMRDLASRNKDMFVPMIAVKDHVNAPIGSWQPGDDILVQAHIPWVGDIAIWHRIVSDSFAPDGTAILTLIRTDYFE